MRSLRRPDVVVAAGVVGVASALAGLGAIVSIAIAVVSLVGGALVATVSTAHSESRRAVGARRRAQPAPARRAPAEATLRIEGEYWTVASGGAPFRLQDAKGLRYLHRLLAAPGVEFHVLDLAADPGDRAERPQRGRPPAEARSAQPVLDDRARAEYRRRIEDLRDDIEEAEANGDPERASRAREELDWIAGELQRQIRPGGRSRDVPDAAERARVNVSRAIRASIAKIAEHDPSLGHHLDRDVRTGTYCSYRPDPGTAPDWTL